jgi:hypothetical protein
MGILDSDSESSYSEDESFGGDDDLGERKHRVAKSNANSTLSVTDGTIENRLSAVLSLKADLGMATDPDYIEKESRKKAQEEAKEKERKRLASMTTEERLAYQKGSVSDLMGKIRIKREKSQQDLMNRSTHSESESGMSDDEMEKFRRLKLKKSNSKKRMTKKPVKKSDAAGATTVKA